MKNPFKSAATADEFLSMLRKEAERIRGKKFRYWKVSQVWMDTDRLVFTIDADYISSKERHRHIDWLELVTGTHYYEFPGNSRLGRWHGYSDFEIHSSSGGSGKYDSTYRKSAYVYLKHLPKLKKLVERNEKIRKGEGMAVSKNAELRRMDTELSVLQANHAELMQKIRTEYRSENPTTDPINGRLIRG